MGFARLKGQVFEIVTLDQATDGNTIIARGILNFELLRNHLIYINIQSMGVYV